MIDKHFVRKLVVVWCLRQLRGTRNISVRGPLYLRPSAVYVRACDTEVLRRFLYDNIYFEW